MYLLPTFVGAPTENEVYNVDALCLLKALPTGSVDLIVTSPPYDAMRTYNGYSFDFEAIAHESYRVLKQGGVQVWVEGDSTIDGNETLTTMRHALYFVDKVGFRLNDTMIYRRQGRFPEIYRYWQDFEYMLVLTKGRPQTFNPQQEIARNAGKRVSTERQQDGSLKRPKNVRETGDMKALSNVWEIGRGAMTPEEDYVYQHPAVFPEIVAERHILTWSNPGDLVLDYFGGSGTTAKMARNNGRRWLTCDVSSEYCDLMRRRLSEAYPLPMFAA